jgi:formylglycine-generating enzyme required for sulfatase activity
MSEHERIAPSTFQPLGEAEPAPVRRASPARWAVIGAVIAFALVLLFLFTAKSVAIRVTATAEPDVSVSGLALPLGQRWLMLAGEHELAVTAPGYHPVERTIEVSADASQSVDVVMAPLPGRVTVLSQPEGASILLDGELIGETPLETLSIAAGEHRLEARAPRHLPRDLVIEIEGRGREQTLDLQLEPAWGDITVSTSPVGATAMIDGEPIGEVPGTLEILEGEHTLTLNAPGFAPLSRDIEVRAGVPQDLGTLTLVPAEGVLTLASEPTGANVTVDGEFRGQTPLQVTMTPDSPHVLMLLRPGYQRHTESIELAAGETTEKTIALRPELGEVVFRVSPPEAELRLNGRSIDGTGSERILSLPAFEHRVEIRLDGYAPVKRKVTPRPGLQQLVAVELKTEQQARMERIKPEITTALGQTLKLFDPANAALSEFSLGASRRDPGRRANEVLHPVRLERMFYIQTTEVTNAQFRLFQASHDSGQVDGNSLNREHQPAVQVSWQQAAAFCNWLSRREGLPPFYTEKQGIITGFNPQATGYRLPTEAEWAWVSRVDGENLRRFSWGDAFPPEGTVENVADNTSAYVTGRILNGYTDGHVVSAPVGSFPPNQNGLFDLGGNVAEWVHDVYTIPPSSGVVKVDPLGSQTGDNFTIRGASWALSKLTELRLTFRDYGQAGRDDVGFRLARYAE